MLEKASWTWRPVGWCNYLQECGWKAHRDAASHGVYDYERCQQKIPASEKFFLASDLSVCADIMCAAQSNIARGCNMIMIMGGFFNGERLDVVAGPRVAD